MDESTTDHPGAGPDGRDAQARGNGVPPAGDSTDSESRFNAYRVQAGEFEGPLDLLLHLVRVNEVDITDIPIATITDQYNDYLSVMHQMDLEVAGEYILMAATLMHIKSRMLLPPDPEAEDDEGEVDPRAELTRQLLEYQRFKQAAENLQAIDSRRHLIWTRDIAVSEFEGEELLTVDMFDLMSAFRDLLGRLGEEARLQLRRDNISVAEKINWLADRLKRRSSFEFRALLEDLPTRLDRIATFLALLEMVRLQMVVIFQRKVLGEIRIARVEPPDDDESAAPGESDGAVADDSVNSGADRTGE